MKKVFEIELEEGNVFNKDIRKLVDKYGINSPFFAVDGVLLGMAMIKGDINDDNSLRLEFIVFNQTQIKEIDCNKDKENIQKVDVDILIKAIILAQNPELVKDLK